MNEKCEKVKSLLQIILEANDYIKSTETEEIYHNNSFLFQDIHDAITTINYILYHTSNIAVGLAAESASYVTDNCKGKDNYFSEFAVWYQIVSKTLEKREKCRTMVDLEFYAMADYINYTEYNLLLRNSINNLKEIQTKDSGISQQYEDFYAFYRNYWGGLLIEQNYFKILENRIGVLKEHLSDFIWLYEELGDYRSKMVLFGILKNWLSFDQSILSKIKECNFADYYDLDLITCDENEVFVDLGAYTGDSTLSFIDTYGCYKKIYCYEITPESIEKIKKTLINYPNIEIRHKGVGAKDEMLYLNRIGTTGAANQINGVGEIPLSIVSIDNDIKEKITFIKMDIEGAEQDALLGCRRHITEEHPKLAICTYHNNEDIWKVPRIIKEMNPEYKLYMRYNGKSCGPTDFVLFAV